MVRVNGEVISFVNEKLSNDPKVFAPFLNTHSSLRSMQGNRTNNDSCFVQICTFFKSLWNWFVEVVKRIFCCRENVEVTVLPIKKKSKNCNIGSIVIRGDGRNASKQLRGIFDALQKEHECEVIKVSATTAQELRILLELKFEEKEISTHVINDEKPLKDYFYIQEINKHSTGRYLHEATALLMQLEYDDPSEGFFKFLELKKTNAINWQEWSDKIKEKWAGIINEKHEIVCSRISYLKAWMKHHKQEIRQNPQMTLPITIPLMTRYN